MTLTNTHAQFCKLFSTKIHQPSTLPDISCAYRSHFPESPAHTHIGITRTEKHIFASFFHPESPADANESHKNRLAQFPSFSPRPQSTWDGLEWGGNGDMLLHVHTCSKRYPMDFFGTYFTHVQSCGVAGVCTCFTHVQNCNANLVQSRRE